MSYFPPFFHSNEIVSYPLFFFPFSIFWCPPCVALYNRDCWKNLDPQPTDPGNFVGLMLKITSLISLSEIKAAKYELSVSETIGEMQGVEIG